MRSLKVVIFFLGILTNCYANHWHPIGSGLNGTVNTIYIDSASNNIYASGLFYMSDSVRLYQIAFWNGNKWDSLAGGNKYYDTMLSIIRYQNEIYSDGRYFTGQPLKFGGKYNGFSWDSIGSGMNGNINQFQEINGLLWIGGFFSKIGSNSCNLLATWDGTQLNCLNVPYKNNLEDFELYNHGLVISGNILDSNGNNVDIAYYDSTNGQWSPLGGGIYGGVTGVHALQVFQGDLYAAGYFQTSAGNSGNNIMKWDGHQWLDVGGGTDDEVYCMAVYNDELYIGGVFHIAGGVNTGTLAKWDGNQWSPVSNSVIDPGIIEDIQFWNDQMYIGGYFKTIDGDSINNIAMYDGLSGTAELPDQIMNFRVFPNPTHGILNIRLENSVYQNLKITIRDLVGKIIFQKTTQFINKEAELNLSTLLPGMYFISLENDQYISTQLIVIDE